MKTCSTCKKSKIVDEFNKNKAQKDGYNNECRLCQKIRGINYRDRNSRKEYFQNYQERQNMLIREKRKLDPEWAKRRDQQTNGRKREAPMTQESLGYLDIMNTFCSYCGEPATTVDHVFPIARGGDSHWLNLAPACKSCNSSKGDKDLNTWLYRRPLCP